MPFQSHRLNKIYLVRHSEDEEMKEKSTCQMHGKCSLQGRNKQQLKSIQAQQDGTAQLEDSGFMQYGCQTTAKTQAGVSGVLNHLDSYYV